MLRLESVAPSPPINWAPSCAADQYSHSHVCAEYLGRSDAGQGRPAGAASAVRAAGGRCRATRARTEAGSIDLDESAKILADSTYTSRCAIGAVDASIAAIAADGVAVGVRCRIRVGRSTTAALHVKGRIKGAPYRRRRCSRGQTAMSRGTRTCNCNASSLAQACRHSLSTVRSGARRDLSAGRVMTCGCSAAADGVQRRVGTNAAVVADELRYVSTSAASRATHNVDSRRGRSRERPDHLRAIAAGARNGVSGLGRGATCTISRSALAPTYRSLR